MKKKIATKDFFSLRRQKKKIKNQYLQIAKIKAIISYILD